MGPVGRDRMVDRMSPLPACALLRAPHSTGKRAVARFAALAAGVSAWDVLELPVVTGGDADAFAVEAPLSMGDVRMLATWSRRPGVGAHGKYAIVRLDHERAPHVSDGGRSPGGVWRASEACLHALLKLTEEPPRSRSGTPAVRFALLAAGPVPETLISRSTVIEAGLLSHDAVADILYAVTDMDRPEAGTVASLSGGRVNAALARRRSVSSSRTAALAALHDLVVGDVEALAARAREWTSSDTDMLLRACHEVVTKNYQAFDAESLAQVPPRSALALLRTAEGLRSASPRLLLGALSGLAS